MSAPISQEIRLPTSSDEVGTAIKKMDELIARVGRLEHAGENAHKKSAEHQKKEEGGFRSLFDAMGKVLTREAELAVGIRAMGAAGLEARGRMGEFLEFIGAEAALDVLKEIGEKIVDIGRDAIKSAADAERMNFALDATSGGAAGGENTRRWLEANAKHSEFTEAQNEAGFLSLRRYGVGTDKAGLFMKAAEDIAAVSAPGEREGVYRQTLDALARVHSMGRIQARSAMQLGIGVDDLKTLPGFSGLSNQKVWAKAEQSNLDENTLLTLIARHTGETKIGEKAADASELLTTKFSKLAELPELFYKRLAETSTIKRLSAEIGGIVEKLDPESPTGRRIFGSLEDAFGKVADVVGEIDWDEVSTTIRTEVIPDIKWMISEIGPAVRLVEKMAHVVGTIGTGFRIAGKAFSDPFGAAGDIVAGKGVRKSAVAQLGEQGRLPSQNDKPSLLSDLTGATLINNLGGNYLRNTLLNPDWWHTSAKPAGAAVGEGFAEGAEGSSSAAADAASGIGEGAVDSLNMSIDAHSPSRKAMKSGRFMGEGFALGIEDSADRIANAWDVTASVPATRYDGASTTAAGIGGDITVDVGGVNIVVDGSSATPEQLGRMIEDRLTRSLTAALTDALSQRRAERGA